MNQVTVFRARHNLTGQALASLLGISERTVWRWEKRDTAGRRVLLMLAGAESRIKGGVPNRLRTEQANPAA